SDGVALCIQVAETGHHLAVLGDDARHQSFRQAVAPCSRPSLTEKRFGGPRALLEAGLPLLARQLLEVAETDRALQALHVLRQTEKLHHPAEGLEWPGRHIFVPHHVQRQAGRVDPAPSVAAPGSEELYDHLLAAVDG